MTDTIVQVEDDSLEEKSREERKANGRLIAVIVAVLLLFIAIYHAWIRKTAVLAGVLVPALIMILYGGWVVFLAKRDKKRRLLLAKQMSENARREILEAAATTATENSNANRSSKIMKAKTLTPDKTQTRKQKTRKNKKSLEARNNSVSQIRKKWQNKPSFRNRIFRQNPQTEDLIKRESTPVFRTLSAP